MHRLGGEQCAQTKREGKQRMAKRQRERSELTGYEVKASLLFRIVFHLAGEQVEFSRRAVSLPEREREGG